jgi:hypothetical protein
MEKLPSYITIVFLVATVLTFFLLINAAKHKLRIAVISLSWLAVTGILSYNGFFQDTSAFPPRLMLVMMPAIIVMIVWLLRNNKNLAGEFGLKKLTLLHVVRVPVELVLYGLAAEKLIPGLMTFAGRNFDIISGITAPIIYFTCFKNGTIRKRLLLLTWNFICLGLLLNIVINAVLSIPSSFQRFAFDQPNIAVLYFPFAWLPVFIVLAVLFGHLVAIGQLLGKRESIKSITTEARRYKKVLRES